MALAHSSMRRLRVGRGCEWPVQCRAMGREGWLLFFCGEGVFSRDGVGWHRPQPGGVLDWGFYRVGERLSEEPGWLVKGSRALQVILCRHGKGGEA